MSRLTAMTEMRALLTRALLTGVFTSLYSARKTCIWESMPGMESIGLPRSLSPNGLSEYKTKSSHLGFANASSIMGFKPKLQLWNWINWGTCAVLICYQGNEEVHRGTDQESDQVFCFDEGQLCPSHLILDCRLQDGLCQSSRSGQRQAAGHSLKNNFLESIDSII